MLFFFLAFVVVFAIFIYSYWYIFNNFFKPKPTIKYKALSIVYPNGSKIARGEKTIEVRSWLPPKDFNGDLLIVENNKFLKNDGDIDPEGTAVALVKIKAVRPYEESDIPAACASRWEPGYFSWELTDVRIINSTEKVLAARGIYEVELLSP